MHPGIGGLRMSGIITGRGPMNAMSSSNVTLIQGLYAAFGRGEINTIVEAANPDIVWRIEGRKDDHPLFGDWKGRAGVQEFFKTLAAGQEATAFSPQEFYPSGDHVFVIGHYGWTMKKTGRIAESKFCHVFTIKDGRIAAFLEFTDTARFAQAYRG